MRWLLPISIASVALNSDFEKGRPAVGLPCNVPVPCTPCTPAPHHRLRLHTQSAVRRSSSETLLQPNMAVLRTGAAAAAALVLLVLGKLAAAARCLLLQECSFAYASGIAEARP